MPGRNHTLWRLILCAPTLNYTRSVKNILACLEPVPNPLKSLGPLSLEGVLEGYFRASLGAEFTRNHGETDPQATHGRK